MYPISASVFTVLVYALVTWAAILATFIVGTGVWQIKQTLDAPAEPTPDVAPEDD